MIALVLALSLAGAAAARSAPAPQEDPVRRDFLALFEDRRKDDLLDLWRGHPAAILVTIDADLEGALALWEQQPDAPDEAAIAHMHERALWGARAASELTGDPVFHDYAASFVGWDDEQKRAFRAGQQAFRRSRAALRAGDGEAAAAAARECVERARPLGDWWGLAMGLRSEGEALAALGDARAAAAALAQARQIFHALGLSGSELACSTALARLLVESGPRARAAAALRHAIALAVALGDEGAQAELVELRERLAAR